MSISRCLSSLIIATLYLGSVYAKVECKKQWGKVKVDSSKACRVILPTVDEPSSLLINGAKWSPNKEAMSFKIKISNPQFLGGFKLTFFSRGKAEASYTLPLYSEPEYNIFQHDLPTWLSIPFSDLKWEGKKKDISNVKFDGMTLYLATTGKNGNTTIDFLDMKKNKKPKNGFISITFDDGYKSNFLAAQIMAPFNLKGTAYLIPKVINKKGYLSERQLKQLKDLGWSLSTHLTTPVTEIKKLETEVLKAKSQVQRWGNKKMASHFALPLGRYNKSSLAILKKHFKSIRLAGGLTQTLPVKDISRLKTINVTQSMKPEEVYKRCREALDNGEWAILMFHYLDLPSKGDLNYSSKNYKKLMELLSKHSSRVKTISNMF